MRLYLPGSSSLGKVHGEDLDRADGQGCFPAQCSHCFLFLLDTYRLQRGCQRPDWECTGCREHQAGQEVLDCLHAGHRCLDFLVSDLPEQSVHGEPKFPVLWRLLFSLCCFSAILPPELFAVTFCVLLLSCKDLVGYIFTTDRWVLRFSWNVKSVVKIWAGAFMLSLLGMLRLRGFLSHLQRQKLTDVTQEQLIGHRNYNLECQYNGHWWRYMLLVVQILMYFREGNSFLVPLFIFSVNFFLCSNDENHLGISESARVLSLQYLHNIFVRSNELSLKTTLSDWLLKKKFYTRWIPSSLQILFVWLVLLISSVKLAGTFWLYRYIGETPLIWDYFISNYKMQIDFLPGFKNRWIFAVRK